MRIAYSSILYVAVSVFSGGLSYLLLPILTDNLSPKSFGSLEVFRSSLALLQGLMIFGTNTLVFGNYFKWSSEEIKTFIHNSIFLFTVIFFILLSLLFIPQFESSIVNEFSISFLVLMIGLLIVYFQTVTSLQTTIFQIDNKPWKYVFYTAGFSLISFIITWVLLKYSKIDWHSQVYGIFIASLLFFSLSIFNFWKLGLRYNFPLSMVKPIIISGFPLIFTHISAWFIEAIDKYMISSMLDTSSTGNYSVNYKFSMIVTLIQIGVLRAWAPFFFKEISINRIENNRKVVKYTYLLILFLILITLAVIFIAPIIFYYLIKNEQYSYSGLILKFICFGYFFDGLWKIFALYLIERNQTVIHAAILTFASLSNVVLNVFLIRSYGIEGSAIATCISFFLGFFATFIVVLYQRPMPWLLKIN